MSGAPITALLQRWRTGDRAAENALLEAVYPLLRDLARAQIRRNGGSLTLQATELAHEAYGRLEQQKSVDWQNRDHFFAIAATLIRRIVVDYQRMRGSEKRGGRLPFVRLGDVDENQMPHIDDSVDWIGLDQALAALQEEDADCARVVELKFFSGLTTERIAELCGSSVATVGRQWRFARAWLANRLAGSETAA
ncbi:MAG TPA: ECF-type sigma factor [Xanthomonadales bacterium]|nr:ECF-type sigma factor [Xanthomonadales bacterium]